MTGKLTELNYERKSQTEAKAETKNMKMITPDRYKKSLRQAKLRKYKTLA